MKSVNRLLRFLNPFIGWVALSILLSTATIASGIGLLGTSAYLIARASLQPSIAVLQVAIVGVRYFGISRGIFRYLERLTTHSVNFRLLAQLRVWLYRTLEPLAPARLQDFSSGDLLNRILGDVDNLENFYVRGIAPFITAGLVMVGMGLFLGSYDPTLGAILVAGMIFSGLVMPVLAYWMSKNPGKAWVNLKADFHAELVERLQGISELTAYNRIADTVSRINSFGKQLARSQRSLNRRSAIMDAFTGLIPNLTMAAILWVSIPLFTESRLEGFLLPVIVLLTLSSFEAVTPLAQTAQVLNSSLESADRLFGLESIPVPVVDPAEPLPIPMLPYSIHLRNVFHRYEANPDSALDAITLELNSGKHIAVVGASGTGKTTLSNVLLRLWDFDAGEYEINRVDVRCYRTADVRNLYSVISQSGYLFNATVRQNLRLAGPNASDSDVHRALVSAGLENWLRDLPAGLDTWIGEHGLRMSGGERQRLAIARAILQDRPIAVLDEPTAHLDALTELAVIQQIQQAFAEKTVLWITHRLIGLEAMDEIVVLEGGRILERGTHSDLIRTGGLYTRLLEVQNRMLPLTFSSPPSS